MIKDLEDVDVAIEEAKRVWDHAEAQYEPTVLGLIRAAELMRRTLSLVESLVRDTDGIALDPDTELPVGVFQQALAGDPGALG